MIEQPEGCFFIDILIKGGKTMSKNKKTAIYRRTAKTKEYEELYKGNNGDNIKVLNLLKQDILKGKCNVLAGIDEKDYNEFMSLMKEDELKNNFDLNL